jgi:hypothetical protein
MSLQAGRNTGRTSRRKLNVAFIKRSIRAGVYN